jgi:ribonuclease VapC
MTCFVLDASAVLAWLWQEEGSARVGERLAENVCLLSSVNLAEIASKVLDKGLPEDDLAGLLASLELEVVPYGQDDALETAGLRASTRKLGLSLGDRACLALAKARGAVAVTADRAWLKVELGVAVECIRGDIQ